MKLIGDNDENKTSILRDFLAKDKSFPSIKFTLIYVWAKLFEVFHLQIVIASYPWFYIIMKILDSKFKGTIGIMA